MRPRPSRREALAAGAALVLLRPARATPAMLAAAIQDFAGDAKIESGRVSLDIPPLVENGNAVPLTVRVESAMTGTDSVRRIGVFNEKNPQPNVAIFHLSPRCGRAVVSTRIRLGDSQKIVAIAEFADGTFWSASADLVVTLPACAET